MRTCEVVVKDVDDADHVVTLKKYTQGDRLAFMEFRLRALDDAAQMVRDDVQAVTLGVASWDFVDDGKPIPVTFTGCEKLDPEAFDAIVHEVMVYNPAVFGVVEDERPTSAATEPSEAAATTD